VSMENPGPATNFKEGLRLSDLSPGEITYISRLFR
jgi:hypothetical protein